MREMRDQREIQTLDAIIDALNGAQYARAVDLCAQRIKSVQRAKGDKGSWEKSSLLELLPHRRHQHGVGGGACAHPVKSNTRRARAGCALLAPAGGWRPTC